MPTRGSAGPVAIAFARERADLGLIHPDAPDGITETSHWVREAGRRAALLEFDVNAIDQHEAMIERVARDLGRIHILVVNTPYEWLRQVEATTDVTELERALRTSLETAFQLCLTVSQHMVEGAAIIITAPMRYAHPIEPVRALVANGQGVATLVANLASTLAPRRIRANAIVPGPVHVPRVIDRLAADARATFGAETLQRRAAQPAELAPAFVFLAAPNESAFVVGATLEATGGPVPAPTLR